MFSKIKKYFKDKNNSIHERIVPKSQIIKQIAKHIKKVENFGTATLIMVDIDEFRNLVETYGEEICNKVLREVSARIVDLLPSNASIAQLKLDGFLIFIPDEGTQSRIERLCKKMLENVRAPFSQEKLENINITASIGVCTYPQSGSIVKILLENLDLATFVSKRNGGNKVTSYYATLSDDERDNRMYYEEIKTAIQKKEFVLYYQPIIDFENKTIFGAEALMRWNHPTKGVLPPQDFIQLMEQTGDIHWVGQWGIERMIRFQQAMYTKFPNLPLVFSLNLCLKQLLNPNMAKDLIGIAQKLNVKASKIMFEITDFMVYEKMKIVEANITRLKAFGFKIAVDGFPLNPQSVLSIQKCPIDVVKLGRIFLKDITNNFSQEKLLVNLLDYCHKNKKIVVCEGIETKDLLHYVKEQKVNYGSGFYFARALDIPSFIKYIEEELWQTKLED
ncbi:MAG: bifunctional diguanylate cyclase/phosphodiesterase [Roseburia sp.]|nr:bifunctional diguanylate cyclase/phosphodiesterase [Anaeroplasma bactoclasticum]MCM1196523.1 bifunctional diguanylate cyclase/phosphodiesterase [Roseburia sp.]MCM1557257.1 bifunctional diguanylate cyclase/phosphodiesterase [Anaeroplasma bactoclasticum]